MKKMKAAREIYDFMINSDLAGNGQGLHYGKRNTF